MVGTMTGQNELLTNSDGDGELMSFICKDATIWKISTSISRSRREKLLANLNYVDIISKLSDISGVSKIY